ncbi:MAG TPA: FTR1 family protein [Solirubrobacteraceae bacterium]|nr:FTR1 family protein [Solirubrobacteraceae bacterium]
MRVLSTCLSMALLTLLLVLPGPAVAASATSAASSPAGSPAAASTPPAITPTEAQTLDMLLALLPSRYENAHPLHDTKLAAPVRLLARAVEQRVRQASGALAASDPSAGARALAALESLTRSLRSTNERFQPWPLGFEVSDLATRARTELARALHPPAWPAELHRQIEPALARVLSNARTSQTGHLGDVPVDSDVLRAYALYAAGPGKRLLAEDPALDAQITSGLLLGGAGSPSVNELVLEGARPARVAHAIEGVRADVGVAEQVLGLVTVSHATIVANGAIIVFREGLEAILILAAITASFVGARRHLRRPVLIGALAGVLVTALTWIVAQVLLHMLGDGGLKLQAVTGLIAIAVLLLITNWFFHRVYWSEWISRFNRRRKAIERFDRVGFLSGQVLGLVLLGLSSVYREGLETVLFLQALQTSAGLGAAALGAGIGLGATLIVGVITFKVQRKLPFKRMLILTGVLIALVLAVMVGTTVHNMQGIGWLPTTTTSFDVSIDWSMWLGVYPTWEGIGAQLGALVFVLGSYFAARELQVRGPRRRAQRASTPTASRVGAADA